MSSVQYLREFINERLTAAAEQIFLEFEKTIVQYEEEIDRQRRLLDITWKPQIKLHRTELPQHYGCKKTSSSVDQEEPEPPQIKEEQEELCSSQGGEQLGLKEETDTFMVTAAEREHSEPEPHREQLLSQDPDTLMFIQSKSKEILADINESVQYEEEIDRQRRLLDITWKPDIKLHRTDVPQQHVFKEEEVHTDQHLWNQERSSSLDQEEPEPPQIKEEQEELCSSQEGEQLGLKEETDTFMVTATYEESEQNDPESNSNHLLSHSSAVAESQNQEGSMDVDSGSTRNRNKSQNNVVDSPTSKNQCNSDKCKKSLECDICGKVFKQNYEMKRHYTVHTGEKPYFCKTCGKGFTQRGALTYHMRIHTGEKPYSCKTCGKMFAYSSDSLKHRRIHTGEKPYPCKTCLKMFACSSSLSIHMRTHTGEKPYHCKTCGKMFASRNYLLKHTRTHTGEKPYLCNSCGKMFACNSSLLKHMRTHTGEKPYTCKTCGKMFRCSSHLLVHIRTHTGERPYHCKTCGKMFMSSSHLLRHMKTHTG
ncbi:zinc finger protein 121 [Oreochromis niloticus]|uniref:zinc finger protein 121 n=1 Tax=Oreochromis niloticus TaxID=8128 RepID=UPI0009052A4D|nr:zinc finger protein 121 [Oreochromis niloticus]